MTSTLSYVVFSAFLTFVSLMLGSFFRNQLWTPKGVTIGLGNRDQTMPPTPIAGRADRAAMNTLENFVLFAALALTAHAAGVDNAQVALGAEIFFVARVLYLLIYLAGLPYLRTLLWMTGHYGLVLIIIELFRAPQP